MAVFITFSCDETSLVGSDLLDSESIDIEFTDTTTLRTRTIPGDSINTGRLTANTYLLGELNDPIFGRSYSDIYFAINVIDDGPRFRTSTFDSAVVAIAYDTSGFYGNLDAVWDLELFQTTQRINLDTTWSNETLEVDPVPISTAYGRKLAPGDTIMIGDHINDTILPSLAHLRLRLNDDYGEELFEAFKTIEGDEDLLNFIPGLYLRASVDRSAMAGLGIGPNERLGDFNALVVYYTEEDGDQNVYQFRFREDRFAHFEHDYSGTPIETFVNNPDMGDSLFFVQGMAGVNGIIDISNVLQFEDKLINKAEIELVIATGSEFNTNLYDPLSLYGARYEVEDGLKINIQDLEYVLANALPFGVFDGEIESEEENGETLLKLRFNITNHVKNFIVNPSFGGELILISLTNSERPNRTVFYGGGHSQYRAKLNLAFTNP